MNISIHLKLISPAGKVKDTWSHLNNQGFSIRAEEKKKKNNPSVSFKILTMQHSGESNTRRCSQCLRAKSEFQPQLPIFLIKAIPKKLTGSLVEGYDATLKLKKASSNDRISLIP